MDMVTVLTSYPRFWRVLASKTDGWEATRGLHLWPLLNEAGHRNILHLLVQPVILDLDTPVHN